MSDPLATPTPKPFPSSRIIALMNQKGGVGKTTTTVNLAAGIARLGRRTLVVDLDPQAHASLHLGVDPSSFPVRDEINPQARSVYDLLVDPTMDPAPAVYSVSDNLAVLPAETDLAGLETELSEIAPAERTTRLRTVLDRLSRGGAGGGGGGGGGGEKDSGFEFILIDCPPSLGVLTLNGLAAAREVLIPMQAHFLALQGVSKLLETVQLVGQTVNPKLTVSGVVLCMHDPASSHVKEVVQDLASFFEQARSSAADLPWKGARVFDPPVRRNIKLAECPSFGQTIFQYAPFCPGALDYKALAQGLVSEWDAFKAAAQAATSKPVVTTRRPAKSRPAAAEAGT
jgi:chromosome partitioning protein